VIGALEVVRHEIHEDQRDPGEGDEEDDQ
jgi:hypothetical protein